MNNNIRIVQSFRGANASGKWLAINTIMYTLSVMLLKKHGYYVKLYCDDAFYNSIYDICGSFYDEIDLSPNNFPAPSKHIYADIKFRVMENEPIGTIHLDGDVFLFKSDILNNIINNDFDVLVQLKESRLNTESKYWYGSSRSFMKCQKPEWAKSKCDAMYNCGVVCIKNEKLKQEYFDTYWKMYEEYDKYGIKEYTVPDIIIEQQYLVDLCEAKNYKVETILPEIEPLSFARNIGYSHLIGEGKWKCLKETLKVIYKYNKEIYFKLKDKFYGDGKNKIYQREWPY
jgi:hypothetical protein